MDEIYILNCIIWEVGVITTSFLQTKNTQPQRGQHLEVLEFETRSLSSRSSPTGKADRWQKLF